MQAHGILLLHVAQVRTRTCVAWIGPGGGIGNQMPDGPGAGLMARLACLLQHHGASPCSSQGLRIQLPINDLLGGQSMIPSAGNESPPYQTHPPSLPQPLPAHLKLMH